MISVIVASLCLIGANASAKSAAEKAKKKPVELLFVQTAEQATLSPNKAKPGTYTLLLKQPAAQVSYFSDRPYRISGTMPLKNFAADWSQGRNSFASVPPNAALRGGLHDNTRGASYNFELKDPAYHVKDNSFTYTLLPLKGQKPITQVINMHSVSLFVDSLDFDIHI